MPSPDDSAALNAAKPSWLSDGLGLFPYDYTPKFAPAEPARVIRSEPQDRPLAQEPQIMASAPPNPPPGQECPNLDTSLTIPTGIGTDYPLAMTYTDWQAAMTQFAGSSTFCPLSTHSATLDVTPPCDGGLTGELTASSTGTTSGRVSGGCYRCQSTGTLAASNGGVFADPSCPSDYPNRSFSYGASGIFLETADFGDAVMDSNGVVWVKYSLQVTGTWTCTTGGCQATDGTLCTIPPAADCGLGGTSNSGDVCTNVLGFADPFATPCSGTSVGITFSGSGWVTGVPSSPPNPGIGLSLCLQDPTTVPGCTPRLDFTY